MHRHTKAGMIMLLSGAMMLNTVTCAFAAGNTDGSPTVLLQGPGELLPLRKHLFQTIPRMAAPSFTSARLSRMKPLPGVQAFLLPAP